MLNFCGFLSFRSCLYYWQIWVSELSNWIAYKKACRLAGEKNGTILGHLCLINYNSEMHNNQNNMQIIFLMLFLAVIFLFQVNSFFLNFCQKIPVNKWLPKLNNRNTLVSLLLNLNTKCFYCWLWTSNCLLEVEINQILWRKGTFIIRPCILNSFLASVLIWYPLDSKSLVLLYFRGYKIDKLVSEGLILDGILSIARGFLMFSGRIKWEHWPEMC